MKNKQLILSLIKDDLINTKLVNGLTEMGLHAENYFLYLGQTIFKLMEFEDSKETEQVFERYVQLTKKVVLIDISESHQPLDELVLEIYEELCKQQQVHK